MTVPRRAKSIPALIGVALVAVSCSNPSEAAGELTIYGPYVGPEADIFGDVLEIFEEETGITTEYVGSGSFDTDFNDRVNSGDLPDVTVLPQLALMGPLIDQELLTPLDQESSDELLGNVDDFWAGLVAPDGVAVAVPYRFVVKSIVWYRPDVFEENGYQVPETIDQLAALSQDMVSDGHTPWCSGMDSALSTGWWATDWVEDLVVRRAGSQAYWSWALLETPFTDDAIVEAMREFQEIVTTDENVDGGSRAMLNVTVEDAIDPMFDIEPGCLMHKQGSFQPVWLPDGVEFGDGTLDVFALPGVEAGNPPMMISGETVVATSHNPAATRFLEFLISDESFQPWLEAGGSLVAGASRSGDDARSPLDQKLVEMVEQAESVVLDASDTMPTPIGTDVFFAGMIDLVAGGSPTDVAAVIQEAVDELPPR